MKKKNISSLVKISNISTKRPELSTPTKRTQTLVFFWFHFGLFLGRSLRLDTKKQLAPDFLSFQNIETYNVVVFRYRSLPLYLYTSFTTVLKKR